MKSTIYSAPETLTRSLLSVPTESQSLLALRDPVSFSSSIYSIYLYTVYLIYYCTAYFVLLVSVWILMLFVFHATSIDPWLTRGQYRPPLTAAEDENGNVYIRGLSRYRVSDEDHALSLMFEVLIFIPATDHLWCFSRISAHKFYLEIDVLTYIRLPSRWIFRERQIAQ